jgi:LemA protein
VLGLIVCLVLVLLLLIPVIYVVMIYNGLVNIRQGVRKAWANIDVVLKQRHDEIPKLVDVCKQYAQFEQVTLEKVLLARNQAVLAREGQHVAALANAEMRLQHGLGQIFAVAEAYPELKSSHQFHALQTRISALENSIADRREFYNDSVWLLNVRIQEFPDVVLARFFNFQEAEFLRYETAETADVNVKQLFV